MSINFNVAQHKFSAEREKTNFLFIDSSFTVHNSSFTFSLFCVHHPLFVPHHQQQNKWNQTYLWSYVWRSNKRWYKNTFHNDILWYKKRKRIICCSRNHVKGQTKKSKLKSKSTHVCMIFLQGNRLKRKHTKLDACVEIRVKCVCESLLCVFVWHYFCFSIFVKKSKAWAAFVQQK